MTVVTLRPDRFAAGGEAIARDAGGRVVFVRGALPGETVDAELTAEKKDWARASTVAVVRSFAGPRRATVPVAPRRLRRLWLAAPHRSMPSAGPRRDRRRRAAAHGRGRRPVVVLGGGVDPVGYRTTVRVAGTADGVVGYRAEQTHDVVAAPACLIAHPSLAGLLPRLRLDPGVEPTLRRLGGHR